MRIQLYSVRSIDCNCFLKVWTVPYTLYPIPYTLYPIPYRNSYRSYIFRKVGRRLGPVRTYGDTDRWCLVVYSSLNTTHTRSRSIPRLHSSCTVYSSHKYTTLQVACLGQPSTRPSLCLHHPLYILTVLILVVLILYMYMYMYCLYILSVHTVCTRHVPASSPSPVPDLDMVFSIGIIRLTLFSTLFSIFFYGSQSLFVITSLFDVQPVETIIYSIL